MFSTRGTISPLAVVWLLSLLLFFAWSGLAQDVIEGVRADSPPEFTIISPLNGETVSGKLIAIIQPREPDVVTSAIILSEELGFKEVFPSDTWTAAWDSASAENGKYELKVEVCNSSACVDQKVDIVIENKKERPVEIPPSSGGNNSGNGKPDPVEPDPSTKPEPVDPLPVAKVELFPSNQAGAFYLRDSATGEDLDKSSGESWKVEPGTYALQAAFFDSFIASIEIEKMRVENDGIAISLEESVVREPFEFAGEEWLPVESMEVRFGFPSSAQLFLREDTELVQFWCLNVERNNGKCSRIERIEGVAADLPVRVDSVSATLIRAKRIPKNVVPQQELFEVLATNREHRAEWISTQDAIPNQKSNGDSVAMERGIYHARIKIPDFPIQFVSAENVRIDANGTFIVFTSTPAGRVEEGVVVHLESGFAFDKGFFSISPDYNSQRTQVCRQWNALLNWCLGEWTPTQETTLEKGTQAFRFFPPDSGETIRMDKLKAQRLLASIAQLKQMYSNRRYFEAQFAREQLPVLDSLFSGIEVSMECANPAGVAVVVEPKPVEVVPTPIDVDTNTVDQGIGGVTDEDIAPTVETVIPTPEQDANTELLSFQAAEEIEIPSVEQNNSTAAEEIPSTIENPSIEIPIPVELPIPEENPTILPPIEEELIPLAAIDSAWEKQLPSQDAFEQNENLIQCDGVQLQNHFDDLTTRPNTASEFSVGGSIGKAKQTMVLTNETDSPQRRIVGIRLRARDQGIKTADGIVAATPLYTHIDSTPKVIPVEFSLDESSAIVQGTQTILGIEQLEFQDEGNERVGVYNWRDFIDAGIQPTTLVHRDSGETIIDTLVTVDLLPFETRIIDPTYDLANATSYAVAWDGNYSRDNIGNSQDSNAGIQLLDIDNNGYRNDLIISAPVADVQGRQDVGAVYLIKDIHTKSGLNGLNSINAYSARWSGHTIADKVGNSGNTVTGSGMAVQAYDLDGNGYANDLIISGSLTNFVGRTDNGAVWMILDADTKIGDFNLSISTSYDAVWYGSGGGDGVGHTLGGQAVFVANIDNNATGNDLVMASSIYNAGLSDNGAVFVVKDIHKKLGNHDLNSAASFDIRFDGNTVVTENLGSFGTNGRSIQLADTDGNGYQNDIIIGTRNSNPPTTGVDGGAIYFIKDIDMKAGIFSFSNLASFDAAFAGASTWNIGDTLGNGVGYKIFDLNGDGYNNDIIFVGINADINNKANSGIICLVSDINTRSGWYDSNRFAATQRFDACWNGAYGSDLLGSGSGTFSAGGRNRSYYDVVNIDGNKGSNDLLIGVPLTDYNAKANSGAVYLIKDINTFSGVNDLNIPTSYSVIWRGALANDNIPLVRGGKGDPVILANLDGNAWANDIVFGSMNADINGKTNSGVVYVILDINTIPNGQYYLGHNGHFFSRYNGGLSEILGDTNTGGEGYFLMDTDGNGYANDLLISSPSADVNNKRDNGGIYYIKDIHTKPGLTDLNTTDTNRFDVKWSGAIPRGKLGDNNGSDAGVHIINIDNNAYANDLLVFGAFSSNGFIRSGTAIVVANINTITTKNIDFNHADNFNIKWYGGAANDTLGDNNRGSGLGFVVADTDGNGYTNDIILSVPKADLNGLTDNGGVYLIKDIAIGSVAVVGPTLNAADFNWVWDGNTNYDEIGTSNSNFPSTFFTNVDNGTTANDLIIIDSLADINGKTDAGAVYLIRNFSAYTESAHWLGYTANFTAMWSGATPGERLGSTFNAATGLSGGPGVQVVDADENTYANDLIISAPNSSTNGSLRGAIYYIKNVDTATGQKDLNHANHSTLSLIGAADGDRIGYSASGSIGTQVLDTDGNNETNDLIVTATSCDCNSFTDNGGIYYIRDFNTLTGRNTISSVRSVDWHGGSNNDLIGATNAQGMFGVQLVDLEGGGYRNDLLLSGFGIDANGKSDSGATYYVRDINALNGSKYLGSTSNYTASYNGGASWNLAYATGGVQIVNVDGNAYANDLLLVAGNADVNGLTDNGAIVLIKDLVNKSGAYDLNSGMQSNFSAMWMGGAASDSMGVNYHFLHSFTNTPEMEPLVVVTNLDGNFSANDLVISAGLADTNAFTNTGSIYMILDINRASGYYDLNNSNSYNLRLNGDNGQLLGMANNAKGALKIVNVDNNQYANDIVIASPGASTLGRVINGAVYVIKDVHLRSGTLGIVNPINYDVSWNGISTLDLLTDNNNSGEAVQLVDLDNNGWANDMIISSSFSDILRIDNGAVIVIRDVERKSGQLDLGTASTYSFAYYGANNNDELGSTNQNQLGVQLVSLDNNSYANDLIFSVPLADVNGKTNNGAVYALTNIENIIGAQDLATTSNYSYLFQGGTSEDRIGDTNNSGPGAQLVNTDGDAYSNDLMIVGSRGDLNGYTNNGIIYFKRNLLTDNFNPNLTFTLSLPSGTCSADLGNQEGADGPCHRAWIETTDTIGTADQNRVSPDGQNDATPFFVYDNQSTTQSDINIYLDFNAALPSTLRLKASQYSNNWYPVCQQDTRHHCLLISTTSTSAGRAHYTSGTQDLNLYFWGDFVGQATNSRVDRNVDSNGVNPV